jgi:hypothetical protein
MEKGSCLKLGGRLPWSQEVNLSVPVSYLRQGKNPAKATRR